MHWFSFSSAGIFMKKLVKGRQSLLTSIRKRKYREVLEFVSINFRRNFHIVKDEIELFFVFRNVFVKRIVMNRVRCKLLMVRLKLLKAVIDSRKISATKRRRKRIWTRRWILRRDELGYSTTLMRELAGEEPKDFRNILRMSESQFQVLLELVTPLIQRENTKMRSALPARVKLEITLRYLAGGETLTFLATSFRVPLPSISIFLPEVLSAIRNVLSSYLQVCI